MLECARYGETEDLAALLDLGADVNHARAVDGATALHMACANGHCDAAALLLARGARHVANAAGNSPLHWACLNGHAAAAELLLARARSGEVDVYAMNSQGRSAFTVAIGAGHEALARSLLLHASAEPPASFAGGSGSGAASGSGAEGGMEEGGEEELEGEDTDLLDGSHGGGEGAGGAEGAGGGDGGGGGGGGGGGAGGMS